MLSLFCGNRYPPLSSGSPLPLAQFAEPFLIKQFRSTDNRSDSEPFFIGIASERLSTSRRNRYRHQIGIPIAIARNPHYRLITTILDPKQAPAREVAALYHDRWEIETALDELKTHLRGAQIVLRSKTPELVRQEFYGLLMAHFAIRGLMHEAALQAGEDPDRISFVHSTRVVQRRMARFVAIFPSGQESLS